MSGGASLGDRPPISIPHSPFRVPHCVSGGGAVKIAVLFDTLHPEWEDADYRKEVEAKVQEAEYDVARALLANGHEVRLIGVQEQLAPMLDRLAEFQPKLVFNGCEGFRGHARHEYAVAGALDLHRYR